MNRELLLKHFDRISDTPDAIPRLRRFILDLAVRGKLVEQDPSDEPASALLSRIQNDLTRIKGKAAARKESLGPILLDELPFAVPRSWQWARLGDRLELINGRAFKPTEWLPKGLPIVRIQNLNSDDAPFNYCDEATVDPRHVINSGSFLISWSGTPGTSFGAFIWQRGKAALNQHIFSCFQRGNVYYDRFLRIAINGRLDEMIAKAHGGVGLQHITKGKLENLPLPIPPLSEQCRVVAKADELMALCDRLEEAQAERRSRRDWLASSSLHHLNNPANVEAFRKQAHFYINQLPRLTANAEQIKQLRETVLNLAVRGRLAPPNPGDEPACKLLKRIKVEKARLEEAGIIPKQKLLVDASGSEFQLPPKWETVKLGNVCNLVTSGSRGWAEYYSAEGPKFIRAQNIRFGKLRFEDLACVTPPKKSEGTRTQVSPGDLLIVITGAGVTNPALLDQDLGEAYVSQHVALIKPTTTDLSRWLLLCLMAPAGGRAVLVERAYGAGKPGLNLDNIRSLDIPLPPLTEQRRIIEKVEEVMSLCDQLEMQLAVTQTESRRLLEAVLHEALAPAEEVA